MIRTLVFFTALLWACSAFSADLPKTPVASDTVCFTLNKSMDCGALIVSAIDDAKQSIYVQAYNFTAPGIIKALVRAAQRKVTMTVILDKISPSQQCQGADSMRDAGVPTYIDHKPKIAHNKVMVIDGRYVVTGSLNFSTNALESNAENTNLIDSPELAMLYHQNFADRLAASIPYDGKHQNPVKACPALAQ